MSRKGEIVGDRFAVGPTAGSETTAEPSRGEPGRPAPSRVRIKVSGNTFLNLPSGCLGLARRSSGGGAALTAG
jgi:hypothetical protein